MASMIGLAVWSLCNTYVLQFQANILISTLLINVKYRGHCSIESGQRLKVLFDIGAPQLSLMKYSRDHFLQVSLTNFWIFSRVSLTIFLQWLHLNNLCRESIAQDCMQVLQWLHLNNLRSESIAQDCMQISQWLHLNNLCLWIYSTR